MLETKELGPIHSNFLILPSPNGTMLIKSIAVRDIMLPHVSLGSEQNLDVETKENIWNGLNKVSYKIL